MAMTGDGLFQAVKAALAPAQDLALQEAALKPMCTAIIDYIKSNGQISVPALGLVAPNGPVTGSATGTIS
jgi:hypothetical protein